MKKKTQGCCIKSKPQMAQLVLVEKTIKKRLEIIGHSDVLPIFIDFFDKRDILERKINKQLVESGLLLLERENIY